MTEFSARKYNTEKAMSAGDDPKRRTSATDVWLYVHDGNGNGYHHNFVWRIPSPSKNDDFRGGGRTDRCVCVCVYTELDISMYSCVEICVIT